MRSIELRICVDCNCRFSGCVDRCKKCRKRIADAKRRTRPGVKERKAELERQRRQDPEVVARKLQLARERYALCGKKPLTDEERKERDKGYVRRYRQKLKQLKADGVGYRPHGASSYWRCPGCGGKMLGSVKRCLPCALTKQQDSNEQNDRGKYQAVYAEI